MLRRNLFALLSILLVALGCATSDDYIELYPYTARVAMRFDPPAVLDEALSTVPEWGEQRPRRLGALFAQAGCTEHQRNIGVSVADRERYEFEDGSIPVRDTRLDNVVCYLPGETESTILVVAHHTRPGTRGIPGEWTGVAMLPSLYRSMAVAKRKHSYLFVGLADPLEYGMGMEALSRALGERSRDIAALVSLEIIGLGPLAAWRDQSDPELWVDLFSTGKALDTRVRASELRHSTHIDARALRGVDAPSIVLYSFEAEDEKRKQRSRKARGLDAIDREVYYSSYRVLASFLGYIDKTLDVRREYLESQSQGDQR